MPVVGALIILGINALVVLLVVAAVQGDVVAQIVLVLVVVIGLWAFGGTTHDCKTTGNVRRD